MKTIIEMAREVFDITTDPRGRETFSADSYGLERFAALVRAEAQAEEREACAKVCEEQEYHYWRATEDQDFTPQDCANAIRARGNT